LTDLHPHPRSLCEALFRAPTFDSVQIIPPCASTSAFAMARPSPEDAPSAFVGAVEDVGLVGGRNAFAGVLHRNDDALGLARSQDGDDSARG
jgi:hypothetical protein